MRFVDTIETANRGIAQWRITDFKNVLDFQARAAMAFSSRTLALFSGVLHVVALSAKPEMVWINAVLPVSSRAVVQHVQPGRDWATENFPRDSMGLSRLSLQSQTPITTLFVTKPKPARVGLANQRQEPGLNVKWAIVPAITTAIVAVFAEVRRLGVKLVAAGWALAIQRKIGTSFAGIMICLVVHFV
jgi:hypothetical protein